MEALFQAEFCHKKGIPFSAIKLVSDFNTKTKTSDFKSRLPVIQQRVTEFLAMLKDQAPIKTTVIIPTFNRGTLLQKAVKSVLSQTQLPEEIIVIDDGSTDDTLKQLQSIKSPLINILHSNKNYGVSAARNKGIQAASGNWIALLDSDDEWLSHKHKEQVDYLIKYPFYNIIQSNEIWIRNGKRVNPHNHHLKPENWIWESSLSRCYISPSSVLLKKNILQKYGGFNENFPACEDYDLWNKIALEYPVGLVKNNALVKTGGHPDQLSTRTPFQDLYRLQSLIQLLSHPLLRQFQKQILTTKIHEKSAILLNGAKKHHNITLEKKVKTMLENMPQ